MENPLAQFNHTFPVRDSVWELVRTINLSLKENALKESVLEKVFDTYWVQFEKDFKEIIETTPETEVATKRKDNDIMLDVLSTVRMLDRRMRNLESSTERQSVVVENEVVRRDSFSSRELRNYITSLFEQELPEEMIFQLISERFELPRSIVRRELERAKEMRKEVKENK